MEKETKIYRGGPFAEIVVVIHTDEPLLVPETCEKWLADASFGPFGQITSAYLLFSYQPQSKGYPYVRIVAA